MTTTRVTHATPSALYAHTPNRNWECESKIPQSGSKCEDIAKQLIQNMPGKKIQVSVYSETSLNFCTFLSFGICLV